MTLKSTVWDFNQKIYSFGDSGMSQLQNTLSSGNIAIQESHVILSNPRGMKRQLSY